MHIRFFNSYEPVTSFYRDLLPALALQGILPEVYLSTAEYRAGRGRLREFFTDPRIKIRSISTLGVSPLGRWQKAWIMLSYTFFAAVVSLFAPRAEVNFFLTQPPLFSLWGWFLKVLRGQRYYCLIMDIYPDVAFQDGLLPEASSVASILSGIARFTWRHADGVVVIGRCQRDSLVGRGVLPEKIHLIPNWVNSETIQPIPHVNNKLREELGFAPDDFIVLYSGNMGVSHEFETLLAAAELLGSESGIHFVFIGDGVRKADLVKQTASRGLENVTFMPFQPPEKLAESLSLGDVHVVSLRDGFQGLVVPSKAYGALAVGRPLIYLGHASGEIALMITESNAGCVVPIGADTLLAETILNYRKNPDLLQAQAENALETFKKYYHHGKAIQAYKRLFLGV